MRRNNSIVFAGGGSGGHLLPGVAVARELRQRDATTHVVFVGTDRPAEQLIAAIDEFERVILPAFPSPLLVRNPVLFGWRFGQAVVRARRLLRDSAPQVVVGLGGFASVAVARAATGLGIPVVLLEQNIVSGRANRWLCRKAAAVCTAFEHTSRSLPGSVRCIFTGNPVRQDIGGLASGFCDQPESGPASPPELLIMGGSQGADWLNRTVVDSLATRSVALSGWRILHQSGAAHLESTRAEYSRLGIEACVQPFFDDVTDMYRRTTLVVCRAGGTTLAELACAGIPAILVPHPHSIRDHQRLNARHFSQLGAAVTVEQTAEDRNPLTEPLRRLLSDPAERRRLKNGMRKLARPNATAQVADVIGQYMD